MHIGFLTPEYVIPPDRIDGGLANYLKKIAHALIERGEEVSIIVLSDQNTTWEDGSIIIHEVKRVSVPRWMYPWKFLTPIIPVANQYLSSRRVARKVWDIHKEHPFDILQASSYMAPGYSLLKNGKIPLVCRISSYTPFWRSASGRQRSFAEYLTDWLEIQQVVKAERAFAPSNCLAEIFSYCEGCKLDIIRTPFETPENVTLDVSYYQEHLSGRKYLLYFGTLCGIKGVDIIIEALPEVLQNHADLSMVFVGRDDGLPSGKQCVDEISTLSREFQGRIIYHPPLSKNILYPVIAHAQGVLMPSRIDNYPNACLEAQSLGIPVVGTHNSSVDEMIIDGKTGFLAKNASKEELIDAIERLLGLTDDQKQKMRQKISDHMHDVFLEDRVGQLVAWYRSVVEEYRN